MWKKIKDFFTNIFSYIAIAIGVIAGFFFATRRASIDFEQLRADNEQLKQSLEQLREQLGLVTNINESNNEQYKAIGTELYNIDRLIERTREDIDSERGDVSKLQDTNKLLRDWIQKYGKEVDSLQSVQ